MNAPALNHVKLFFETYCSGMEGVIVHDFGVQNNEGSLKAVLPAHLGHVGIDLDAGDDMDGGAKDPYRLPLADGSVDVLVCDSGFGHSPFFWLMFLDLLRILKPSGLLYLKLPTGGSSHSAPMDCWRFYPDAGRALESWANRNGGHTELLESFVGERSPDGYDSGRTRHDSVAVFVKDRQHASAYPARMLDKLEAYANGFDSRTGILSRPSSLSPEDGELLARERTIDAMREEQVATRERLASQSVASQELERTAEKLQLQLALREEERRHQVDRAQGEQREQFAHQEEQLHRQFAQRDEALHRQLAVAQQELAGVQAELQESHRTFEAQLQATQAHLNQVLQSWPGKLILNTRKLTGVARVAVSSASSIAARLASVHALQRIAARLSTGLLERAKRPPRRDAGNGMLPGAPFRRRFGGARDAADAELIRASGQFDEAFYRTAYPDLPADIDVIAHYCDHGWRERRDPSSRFSTEFYLETNEDIRAGGINPFAHYIAAGAAELRLARPEARQDVSAKSGQGAQAAPVALPAAVASGPAVQPQPGLRGIDAEMEVIRASRLFDEDYYRGQYPDVAVEHDALRHFCEQGWREGKNPSAVFDTSFYLEAAPDLRDAGMNPLLHYATAGVLENRAASPASDQRAANEAAVIRGSGRFGEAFYRAMNPDLQPTPQDPVRHYCEFGWREGRDPSDDFSTNEYLVSHPDIAAADLNPFLHYVVAGAAEGRAPHRRTSASYEDDAWFGRIDGDVRVLAFHTAPDWASLRSRRALGEGDAQWLMPHGDAGFYAPADRATLQRQAVLARRHAIHGFCFTVAARDNGRIEATALLALLEAPDIDLRFCLVLHPGISRSADGAALLRRACTDPRAIRVAGLPLVLARPISAAPDFVVQLPELRAALIAQGVGPVFLVACWTEGPREVFAQAVATGACDAVLDLPEPPVPRETGGFAESDNSGGLRVPYQVVASQGAYRAQCAREVDFPLYQAVSVGRDNAASGDPSRLVYQRFEVADYRRWLDASLDAVRAIPESERRFLFLQSWNDWNQGQVLEPDRRDGYARLNETSRAQLGLTSRTPMPKVSVIVPNYNHARFLRQRLDSVYGQTYTNIEVLLLDDYSSDESRAVLDEYAARHPEITRTIYNASNSGSGFRQWARGIKAATGDLVWIAESDDWCDENFLEILVRKFDDEAVLLAYGLSVFVHEDGTPKKEDFYAYVGDLTCAHRWRVPYLESAHREVRASLGIKNTIPNASGALFRRPVDMELLDDPVWLSMRVVGDWVFYLHIIRGGRIAFVPSARNYFRRHEGSTTETMHRRAKFFQEIGLACRTVARLYDVPLSLLEHCRANYRLVYHRIVGNGDGEFDAWFDFDAVLRARAERLPNVVVSTMGFFPGGAEILPIRLANEFKRQGASVLLLSAGLHVREQGVRRMLRNDIPVMETSNLDVTMEVIDHFGIDVLNTHQWYVQKYPALRENVFAGLRAHVAVLHGMIEHGNPFTGAELRAADRSVTTWVYTADKNLGPFRQFGLIQGNESRFVKMPNGIQTPLIDPVPRESLDLPEDAFVLCCVSRAIPDKGWVETVAAVARARQLSGRDIHLVLVGNGPVYEEYRRAGVPGFVHLVGFHENSAGHYAAADMGIMLTRFRSESFPLTILDCLFAGKSFIATDVGDIRNMLSSTEGMAGDVIDLADWQVPVEAAARSIAAFAGDRARYAAAQALVPQVAARYRIETVASQYIEMFRDAIVIDATQVAPAPADAEEVS